MLKELATASAPAEGVKLSAKEHSRKIVSITLLQTYDCIVVLTCEFLLRDLCVAIGHTLATTLNASRKPPTSLDWLQWSQKSLSSN